MANTISNIVPQLLVGALPTLREQSVMPRLVNRSIGDEARDKGDTIDVPIASAISARNVTAAGQEYEVEKVETPPPADAPEVVPIGGVPSDRPDAPAPVD